MSKNTFLVLKCKHLDEVNAACTSSSDDVSPGLRVVLFLSQLFVDCKNQNLLPDDIFVSLLVVGKKGILELWTDG